MRTLRTAGLLWMLANVSAYGQISLTLRAEVTTYPDRLEAAIFVSNQGREEARDIELHVGPPGDVTLPSQAVLAPGSSYEGRVSVPVTIGVPGRYPLRVTVQYRDMNGYPFSAILCANFFRGEETTSELFGTIAAEPLEGSGRLRVRLKNLARERRDFSLEMFTPRELSCADPGKLSLDAGEEREVVVELQNFSALAGSRYPVYAIAQYEREGRHYTAILTTTVQVAAAVGLFARYRTWLVVAVVAMLLIGIISVLMKRRRYPPITPT